MNWIELKHNLYQFFEFFREEFITTWLSLRMLHPEKVSSVCSEALVERIGGFCLRLRRMTSYQNE
jgi:hypothetical protein